MEHMIGKRVIVRANVGGVHAGEVEFLDATMSSVTLKSARRLWRYYTQDDTGSVSDIAANGLMKGQKHMLGAMVPSVTLVNPPGLELCEMTKAAWETIENYE